MYELRNFTPHPINLRGRMYPSQGIVRCDVTSYPASPIDGIPVNRKQYGQVQGLPEPQDRVYYIVSTIVAAALRGTRDDLLVPDEIIRDALGNIIGCNALARL